MNRAGGSQLPPSYYNGREARKARRPCLPPHGFCASRFWWVAGWNDRDMELNRG